MTNEENKKQETLNGVSSDDIADSINSLGKAIVGILRILHGKCPECGNFIPIHDDSEDPKCINCRK